MSMLAETRRRQKWSLNPRGVKGESKFAKGLMEKMGWNEGQGLGTSMQGIVNPITLKVKNDSKGVGFEGVADAALSHQDAFEALLKGLKSHHSSAVGSEGSSANNSVNGSGKSGDEKSGKTNLRDRQRYHKARKAKDAKSYSKQDLDSIVGKAAEREKENEVKSSPSSGHEECESYRPSFKCHSEPEEGCDGGKDESGKGFVTINRGSASDYFKQKLIELQNRGRGDQGAKAKNGRSAYVGHNVEESASIAKAVKKASRKDKKCRRERDCQDANRSEEDEMELRTADEQARRKRKKNKRSKKGVDDEESVLKEKQVDNCSKFVAAGNINDYFAAKMAARKAKAEACMDQGEKVHSEQREHRAVQVSSSAAADSKVGKKRKRKSKTDAQMVENVESCPKDSVADTERVEVDREVTAKNDNPSVIPDLPSKSKKKKKKTKTEEKKKKKSKKRKRSSASLSEGDAIDEPTGSRQKPSKKKKATNGSTEVLGFKGTNVHQLRGYGNW